MLLTCILLPRLLGVPHFLIPLIFDIQLSLGTEIALEAIAAHAPLSLERMRLLANREAEALAILVNVLADSMATDNTCVEVRLLEDVDSTTTCASVAPATSALGWMVPDSLGIVFIVFRTFVAGLDDNLASDILEHWLIGLTFAASPHHPMALIEAARCPIGFLPMVRIFLPTNKQILEVDALVVAVVIVDPVGSSGCSSWQG